MPILTLDLTTPPGYLIQVCVACGYQQRINLDVGATCTKEAPYVIAVDSTLEVTIDGGAPQTVTFEAGSFPNFNSVSAEQLRDKFNDRLMGVASRLDESPDCVVIESTTTGPSSKVEITGGTARAALGLDASSQDLAHTRPVLGISTGGMKLRDSILLRRCNGCTGEPEGTTHEIVKRTWDVGSVTQAGKHSYEHRRATNALARYLKAQGMVHPDLAADYAAETSEPADYTPGAETTVLDVPRLQQRNEV